MLGVGALVCREWNVASRRREAWVTFRFRGGVATLQSLLHTHPTVRAMLRFVEKVDIIPSTFGTTRATPPPATLEVPESKVPTEEYASVLHTLLNVGQEEEVVVEVVEWFLYHL